MASGRQVVLDATATAVAGLALSSLAAALAGHAYMTTASVAAAGVAIGLLPALFSAIALLRRSPRFSTIADRVTLTRAVLASGCAALTAMALVGAVPVRTWWMFGLAASALLLDAVDGAVARRTGSASEAGAHLDMQVDAGLLVVLSIAVALVLGPWVLLIGAMRYLYVAATWLRPELGAPLPRSEFRRWVSGLQGTILALAIAPIVPEDLATSAVLFALVMLLVSFGSQVVILERAARDTRWSPDV